MRVRYLALLAPALVTAMVSTAAADPERPFRTRAADERAWQLLSLALSTSPTVGRLVTALEHTDAIVLVELCMMLPPSLGDTRILSAGVGVRHVRVRVTTAATRPKQLAVLGHELQHAVEIASAPEVRDTESLERLLERIGFRHWRRAVGGGWETLTAIEIEKSVASEVRAAKLR